MPKSRVKVGQEEAPGEAGIDWKELSYVPDVLVVQEISFTALNLALAPQIES
jgi:hypothetical protein